MTSGDSAPPLPAWVPVAWVAVLAGVLAGVVVVLIRPPGPLDQSDPAYQRDGLLREGAVLPAEVADVAFGGRPVVLLFDRRAPDGPRLAAWLDDVPPRAAVRLVLPAPAPELPADLRSHVVVDPGRRLAQAVGLPAPVDGGPGVGYAVVDSTRRVRYATLDPAYPRNGFEVATMVGAVP